MVVIPPVIVSLDPNCWFYRDSADALAAGIPPGARVFDGTGQRLVIDDGHLSVLEGDREGTDELSEILTAWLMHMDAIRWSIADWQLSLLLRCSIERFARSCQHLEVSCGDVAPDNESAGPLSRERATTYELQQGPTTKATGDPFGGRSSQMCCVTVDFGVNLRPGSRRDRRDSPVADSTYANSHCVENPLRPETNTGLTHV